MNDGSSSDLDLGQTIRGFAAGQKLFGRFSLVRILGRGGMGVVWLARDEDLGRDVALKFLPELIIHDKAVLDDLKRETTRSLELTHHNIVRIYDFVQDGLSACISMEYVDGETLSALRVERPNRVFEVEELSLIVAELCEALTYAHTRAAIVHRDLKPANLMLNSKSILKITDFGIARSLSDSVSMLTRNWGTSGTLLYMSPQQLDGERSTPQDDIYSVGATIYELLTSKPPFYSGGIERQIREKLPTRMTLRRADLNITSETSIPEHWEHTVAACLAKDPADRPQTASELADRFRGLLRPAPTPVVTPAAAPSRAVRVSLPSEEAPTMLEPAGRISPEMEPALAVPESAGRVPPPMDPPPPKPGSRKTLAYAGGLILLLLLGGVVLALYLSSKREEPAVIAELPKATPIGTEVPSVVPAATAPSVAVAIPSATPEQTSPSTPAKTKTERSAPYQADMGYNPAIAVVDMQRVFKEYHKTKDAEAKVNDAKNAAKKEFDDRSEGYKKSLDEINKLNQQLDAPALTADARARKAKERDEKIANIKFMETQINEFRQTREQQLQQQAMRMREDIVAAITNQIRSEARQFTGIVFDKSGLSTNYVPLMLFTPAHADMSAKVISGLNANQPSSFAASHDFSFAVVDMQRIFKEYHKTKDAEAKVNDAKNAAKKEFDDRTEGYKKSLDEINKLNQQLDVPALAADAKARKAKERDEKIANIKVMETQINEFRQTREQQLQQQAMRMREGIVKEITDMIGTGLQRESKAVIVDISGLSTNYVPLAVFVRGVPDYSDEVITALNRSQAGTSLKFKQTMAPSLTMRFGVIDMQRAFKLWPETKGAEAKVNEDKAAAKKQFDDRTDAYKKALEEINDLNKQLDLPSLSADTKTAKAKMRDEKIANIKNVERDIKEFRETREKQLQDQATKMREGIVAKIRSAVNARAEKEKFNVVFDSSGNSTNYVPIVILSQGLPDLTDNVLKP
jgi:serine/threonine protein kinase/Skp family chaperone for outer membrane proteins